jgi:hypothetical protein
MEMHAVVVDVAISDREQAQKELRERVVPMVSRSPDFVSGVWIAIDEGHGHSVAVFETEEAANAMAEMVRGPGRAAVTIESIGVHEVVANA